MPVGYRNDGRIINVTSDKIGTLKQLRDEAASDAYSVLSFSAENCPACRQFEPLLERLANARADVQIKIIHLPAPPPQCVGAMNAAQFAQCEPIYASIKAEYKRIGVYHTTHVAIYDPKGGSIAEDACSGTKGLQFLTRWLQTTG